MIPHQEASSCSSTPPELAQFRRRIALGVSYLGTEFDGWQTQPSGQAVEDHLRVALAQFMGQECPPLVAAGRTDSGVHALMQVVHFDTGLGREEFSWVRGTNRYLPQSIAIQWAKTVPDHFHARFLATSRRYVYILRESAVRPSLDHARVGWVFRPLDQAAMQAGASVLLGTHDFSSFRAAECQARTPVRTLMQADVSRKGAYWRFAFEGDAFLHHMIRNIMGCLVAIGQGLKPADWMRAVLDARSRDAAAPTFAPDGLYFVGPRYPAEFGLPDRTDTLDWLP